MPNAFNPNTTQMVKQDTLSEDDQLTQTFLAVLNDYHALQDVDVRLKFKELKKTTMRATPVFIYEFPLTFRTRYEIEVSGYVRGNTAQLLTTLPELVLDGWFAHELGHIEDYQGRSWLSMIGYGLSYLWNDNAAKKIEHTADINALSAGFYNELLATKQYLFDEEIVEEEYSKKLRKLYMSIPDLQQRNQEGR